MNARAIFKNILLLIMIIISCFFIVITNKIELLGIFSIPFLTSLTLSINIALFEKRKSLKKNKILKFIFILLTIINLIWIIYYIYSIISYFINYQAINSTYISSTYFYLITIFTFFLISLSDIKKETNQMNDILTIIVLIAIILVHYRYYLDKGLLHNVIGNSSNYNTLQNRYIYITQYYPHFIIMMIILLFNKKINNIKQ